MMMMFFGMTFKSLSRFGTHINQAVSLRMSPKESAPKLDVYTHQANWLLHLLGTVVFLFAFDGTVVLHSPRTSPIRLR